MLAAPGLALAQGTGTPTTAAQTGRTQQSATVQVGAGSKGDVTPGASGPRTEGDDVEKVEPLEAGFRIRPPSDPFLGPMQLPIRPPDRLRCDLIQDAAAQRRCESRAASRPNGGTDGG
jgi:hypothetical protein